MVIMYIAGIALFLVGIGAIVSAGACIMAIEFGRRRCPITYISISDRQNGRAGEILKVRKRKYKDGTEGFEAKRTVVDGGLCALFMKWTPVNSMEKGFMMTKKTGGVLALSYSPCEHVELPIDMIKDDERLKLIVQTIEVGNWYRMALKQTVLSKLLNPKDGFWAKHPGAVIIMSGIIVLMLLVVGLIFIPQISTAHNAQISATLKGLTNAFESLGVSISGAASGAQVVR